MRVPATVVVALGVAAVVSAGAFFSEVQAPIEKEATTKHTKSTKNCIFGGTACAATPSSREVSLTLKKRSAIEGWLSRAMPFVLFVCFVVTSLGFDMERQHIPSRLTPQILVPNHYLFPG